MSTCSNSRSGLGEDLMPSESVRCEIRPWHQIPSPDVSPGPYADSQRRASSVWLSEALTSFLWIPFGLNYRAVLARMSWSQLRPAQKLR